MRLCKTSTARISSSCCLKPTPSSRLAAITSLPATSCSNAIPSNSSLIALWSPVLRSLGLRFREDWEDHHWAKARASPGAIPRTRGRRRPGSIHWASGRRLLLLKATLCLAAATPANPTPRPMPPRPLRMTPESTNSFSSSSQGKALIAPSWLSLSSTLIKPKMDSFSALQCLKNSRN
jgi:hypothetical protein